MQKKQDKYPGVYPRGEFFEIKVAFYDPTEKKKVRVSYSNNFATAKQAFEAREQAMCEIRVNGIPEFYRKRMAESDTNVLNNSMTMAEFLTYWYENVHRPTIAPYTAVGDEVDIRVHMIPAFGDVKICHLTSKHLQKLFEHMRTHPSQGGKGLKFNTADHVRRVLSKALNWAIKKRLIDENYATDAYIQPDESAFEASVLNTEQAKALINALNKEPVFGLALKLQLLLGVRAGEALAIRFSDCNFDNNTIVVKRQVCLEKPRKETPDGKEVWGIKEKLKSDRGGKSRNRQLRALPIPAWLTQEIKSQQIKYKTNKLKYGKDFIDSDLVTCDEHGGFYTPYPCYICFKALMKRLGLPEEVRQHDLRHTYASFMVEANIPQKTLANALGHSSTKMLDKHYSHDIQGAYLIASALEEVFPGKRNVN